MTSIPLTQGKVAYVDDADAPALLQFKWYAHKHRDTFYARRNETIPNWMDTPSKKRQRNIKMHRQILEFPDFQIDHRDRNGLNNQRANLRPATQGQNNANSKKRKSSSQYRGVYWDKYGWKAQITITGQNRYLGFFKTEQQAALAYNEAARTLLGEFASLNTI